MDPTMGSAAVSGGFGLLSTLMQQKAENERRKREAEAAALQRQGQIVEDTAGQQSGIFGKLMDQYGRLA